MALSAGNNNANTTFSGVLYGGGSLNKIGSGVLVLTSSNTYSGSTTVTSGMLVAANGSNGSVTGSGLVTLNGGALASDPSVGGTIGGNVLSGSGANAIVPGGIGTIGTLNIGGNVSLNSNSTLEYDLDGASADILNISGSLSFTGMTILQFMPLGVLTGSYTLATFKPGSPVRLGDFNAPAGVPTGYALQVGSGYLTLVPSLPGPAIWTSSSSGSWTNANNWSSDSVPSGQAAQAVVGAGTATPLTITLDGPQTLGTLTFANTSSATTGYTLAPGTGGTLTMNDTGSTANFAQIFVNSGSHGISAPVVLAESLSIIPSASTTLDIAGNISGSGTLLLDGPGTLILSSSNSYSGGTTVAAGTLIATSSESLLDGSSLTVGANAGSIFAAASPAAVPALQGLAAVPEPGTLALFSVAGLVAAAAVWRRRRN